MDMEAETGFTGTTSHVVHLYLLSGEIITTNIYSNVQDATA